MERKSLELNCVIEKEGNSYSALCLELDVVSCGETPEIASSNIKDAVIAYLDFAVSTGHFEEYVPRSIPKHLLKQYQKRLREKSSEHRERLRPEHLDYTCPSRRIILQPQYAF